VTCLAVDPGTGHLGWSLSRDGQHVADGLWTPTWESPLEYLPALMEFLDLRQALAVGSTGEPITVLAHERMFIDTRIGGNAAALLNVSTDQIESWCKAHDVTPLSYANSTIKKAVTGNGWAPKEDVRRTVIPHVTKETVKALKAMTKATKQFNKLLENVTDAIAIEQTAIMRGYRP